MPISRLPVWFMKDPKKILRSWFEQQGQRLEFEVEEDGPGHARVYTAHLKLPIEGAFGQTGTGLLTSFAPLPIRQGRVPAGSRCWEHILSAVTATGVAGRKKDAETECAVDACTKLDSKGLLRTESGGVNAALAAERKQRMAELFGDAADNDDDDEFFDRAGSGS